MRCGELYCLISENEEPRLLRAGDAVPEPAWDKEHSTETNEGRDEQSVMCTMYVSDASGMQSTHKLDPCSGEGKGYPRAQGILVEDETR